MFVPILKDMDYNSHLRSKILICSLREEEAASNVIRLLLRTVKSDSKTLGNKSSSLSFKNKIDLLYDIDDLTKEEYNSFLKFMEIRNQFIHNPKCNSFKNLEVEAPELSKFLKKDIPKDIIADEDYYTISFKILFINTMAKLISLKILYDKGYKEEMIQFVNSKTLDSFFDIFKIAHENWKKTNAEFERKEPHFFKLFDDEISKMHSYLNSVIINEKIKILDALISNEISENDVFRRTLKKIKGEIKKISTQQGHI